MAWSIVLDQLLGEPPAAWHPVARFGAVMAAVEDRCWADRRRRGVLYGLLGATIGGAWGAVVPLPVTGATAIAGRMLVDAGRSIDAALQRGDLESARALLPTLVGRDPAALDEGQIARAVIESMAENLVDAVVAPVLWGVALGGPGVGVHRAVNTLDAMVGHRSVRHRRFGWASARADDAMAWVPARVTAVVVGLLRPHRAGAVIRAVRTQAPQHPSPNGGVVEAAFAAALGVRLGGVNVYGGRAEDRGVLGDGPPAGPCDIERACRLFDEVRVALVVLLVAVAVSRRRSRGGRRRRRSGGRPRPSRPTR